MEVGRGGGREGWRIGKDGGREGWRIGRDGGREGWRMFTSRSNGGKGRMEVGRCGG